MNALAERLVTLRERIAQAALAAGREPESVRLVAVSKTFPANAILNATDCGLHIFGENRVQEAAAKITAVTAQRRAPLEWHLVGTLQRNKARRAVELFDVIHSIDRIELARAIDRAASEQGRRPRILLQVNLDAEVQKTGVAPAKLPELVDQVAELRHLKPEGLMALPSADVHANERRSAFARLHQLREKTRRQHPSFQELSMGMSGDFEEAIAEGATWIRLGTAIFGKRT